MINSLLVVCNLNSGSQRPLLPVPLYVIIRREVSGSCLQFYREKSQLSISSLVGSVMIRYHTRYAQVSHTYQSWYIWLYDMPYFEVLFSPHLVYVIFICIQIMYQAGYMIPYLVHDSCTCFVQCPAPCVYHVPRTVPPMRYVHDTNQVDGCCLHIKPFFLPNDIRSTPSVCPDSSSQRDT